MSAIPTIPENAPFSPKQRAWLNGFFAGLVSTGRLGPGSDGAEALASFGSAAAAPPALAGPTAPADVAAPNGAPPLAKPESWKDVESDDPTQYPWHDSAMTLEDRLKAAEGRPLELRMMAATAQLNCGQCGYLCRTYAKAIQTGEEKDVGKCVPGGKQTARVLARLQSETATPVASPASPNGAANVVPAPTAITAAIADANAPRATYSRQNPFPAPAISVVKLTADGSAKDTRLVSLSLSGSGLQYKVGDALGVFPKNAKEQVEALIRLCGHDGGEPVRTADGVSTTFRAALCEHCDIKSPSDSFLHAMVELAPTKQIKRQLQQCLDGEEVEGLPPQPRLIDVVARFREIKLPLDVIVKSLDSLKPRLYSIASSPLVDPNVVELVVGVVQYELAGQQRRGVASTFLANRMIAHEPVPVFVQPCHHFGLPTAGDVPIVMVGPGTGVAPFRGFLHERRAAGATGDNWLFFGDQHAATDFLLKDELAEMRRDGLLTRLSTAFSRDQQERVYVQNRMWEEREELWRWLERGAHFYVCGDASKMAGDVDRTLHRIVEKVGGLSSESAAEYVRALRKANRYQRDVY